MVYNFSRGENELQSLLPWLLNIQARAPSSPVIIVGTHVDKIPRGMWSVSFPAQVMSLEIQLDCYICSVQSENLRNLEIAQVLRLCRTYICTCSVVVLELTK